MICLCTRDRERVQRYRGDGNVFHLLVMFCFTLSHMHSDGMDNGAFFLSFFFLFFVALARSHGPSVQ